MWNSEDGPRKPYIDWLELPELDNMLNEATPMNKSTAIQADRIMGVSEGKGKYQYGGSNKPRRR